MRGPRREEGSQLAAFPSCPGGWFDLPPMRRRRRSSSFHPLAAAMFLAFAVLSAGSQISNSGPPSVSISLLQPPQMSREHASLASAMQEPVARSAAIYGYTLDSSYDYREIVCPFAPRDVLLAYESVSPNGAISRFTAVLSPGSGSRRSPVQIIPILHFGVTPFVPAYSNPHSIEIFNQAVDTAPVGSAALAEIQVGRAPIVLRGLCYLAMIGAEPSALRSPSLEAATFLAPVPTLQFLAGGRTRQLISIRNSTTTYQVWTLTFSAVGTLLASSREEHAVDRRALVLRAAAQPAAPSMSTPPVTTSSAPATNPAPQPAAVAASETTPTEMRPAPPVSPVAAVAASPLPQPPVASPPVAPAPVSAPGPVAASPASQPAPLSQPMAAPSPVSPPAAVAEVPVTEPALAVKDAAAAPPAPPATPPPPAPVAPVAAAMVAPPAPATPALPVANSYRAMQPSLPEPPRRFIPDPPPPPRRFVPASALQTPPHLPQ